MLTLQGEWRERRSLQLLCVGAHCDDIEIGCGGTVLTLVGAGLDLTVTWVVLSSGAERAREAVRSAELMLAGATKKDVRVSAFRDGFLGFDGAKVKEYFEELHGMVSPELVLTHYRNDLHQDHRFVSDLTWQTFRDQLILEYEIPKFDGDLGSPNVFVHLDEALVRRKTDHIRTVFKSQHGRRWFSDDLFLALPRLRGLESNAPGGYAEGFYARKLVLA